jgi:hypothetical protein
MKKHFEFRIAYNKENIASFFAPHAGDAVSQLNAMVGESFKVSDIDYMKVATDRGWKEIPVPKFETLSDEDQAYKAFLNLSGI